MSHTNTTRRPAGAWTSRLAAVLLGALLAASCSDPTQPKTGSLLVTATGLPAGLTPNIRLARSSDGVVVDVAPGASQAGLAQGSYTLLAPSIASGGSTYDADRDSVPVTIAAGAEATASVNYTLRTGTIDVTIAGLPAGASANVVLSGRGPVIPMGSSSRATARVGTWRVTALPVTFEGLSYSPTPALIDVEIERGSTAAASITYSTGDFSVDYAYVTQAVQRPDGTVPLVAGRPALLRIFGTSGHGSAPAPKLRARLYAGQTLVRTVLIDAPGTTPSSIDETRLTSSWNSIIPANVVQPDLRVLVDVDPSYATAEANTANNVWPRSGAPRPVSVVNVPPFNVRFVPVIVGDNTGNVTEANKDAYLRTLKQLFPLDVVTASVREPFLSSATLLQSNNANNDWLTVLSEMNALRNIDGAPSGTHYYGVVKVGYSSGIAGYGYVGGRAAMGWDHLPSGDNVAAHEWGHNFNRPHAPCGAPGNPEAAYPHAGGIIGVMGWNATADTLVQRNATDIMSYCNRNWISDWAWTKSLQYRQATNSMAAAHSAPSRAASAEGLLVWGRISNGTVILEPSFRVDAPPTITTATSSSHRLEARDRSGRILLDIPVETHVVDHATGNDERQFAVVIPWTSDLEQSLATLRVRDVQSPLAAATRSSAVAMATDVNVIPVPDEPVVTLEPLGTTRSRLTWNASAYPMAMVRDASSGDVIAFVRNAGQGVAMSVNRPVEVVVSDGVRSMKARVQR